MAGSRIKGITIELDGDTTKLTTALKNVNSSLRNTQSDLRDVNRLLKFNPGNTDLLAQKQKSLARAIEDTKSKLKQEQEALRQLQEGPQNESTVKQQESLTREIESTQQSLKRLTQEYQNFGSVSAQKLQAAGQKMQEIGKTISGAGEKLMPLTAAITGIGAVSVKTAGDFEAQMSRVQAISGATGNDFDKLRQEAIDLGASTSYGATEVAQGMENMASAGFSTNEIIAAMPGMLNLAASSGEDLASSADIAAAAVRGFGLDASQTSHVADVLAQNAAATNAAVGDTGEALKYIAPVANAAGLSLEEVTAAIGIMSNAGIKGSEAGTTLRGALTRLMNPTQEVQAALDSMGVSVYDSNGKMRSLNDIISQIRTGTAGWTDEQKQSALATIFGTNALSGMMALVNSSPDELANMTKNLQNCDGAAKNMADTMMNNTKGAIEQMKGALETAAIQVGTALAPAVTAVANFVSDLATAFSSLSPQAQKVILVILGIVAALGPVLIIVGKVITSIGVIISAVGKLQALFAAGTIVSKLSFIPSLLGAAGSAISGVFAAILPVLPIIIGIAAAIAAVILVVQNWGTISQWFQGVWTAVCAAVQSIGQALGTFFSGLWDGIKTKTEAVWNGIQSTVSSIWTNLQAKASAVFEAVKTSISNAWENVKSKTSAVWSSIQSMVQSKASAMRSAIDGAINNIKSIWSSGFSRISSLTSSKLGSALSSASSILSSIYSTFSSRMAGMKSVVSGGLSAISSFFASCHLRLPHIALPHFSISGSFSIKPPSVPHIGVSWYKKAMDKGMILDSPTIFGMKGNTLLGAGEAGPEAIIGVRSLQGLIQKAMQKAPNIDYGGITINVYGAKGQDVGQLADEIERRINQKIVNRRAVFQ